MRSPDALGAETELYPWPPWRIVSLVERLRDGAAERLRQALPKRADDVERSLVGRKVDGADAGRPADRIRILPLPSIGHAHADRAIRRIAVDAPPGALLSAKDVNWAFSALDPCDPETGEVDRFVVTPSTDDRMFAHFTGPSRRWSTVTPAALPEAAQRRRIDPKRRREEAKGAKERGGEEQRAMSAVLTALRHADVAMRPVGVVVQREPFDAKGARAERFASPPRFPKERLWHVELTFAEPVSGPLVIGDGRFLGLGFMAPTQSRIDTRGVLAFEILGGLVEPLDPVLAARALRRAVMSRVAETTQRRQLAAYFTGHDPKTSQPVHDDRSTHLAFHAHGAQLWIIAPHRLDRRAPDRDEHRHWTELEQALEGLRLLRAGRLGALELGRIPVRPDLLETSAAWRSVTPYRVQRHERAEDARAALALDVLGECARRGLPRPDVKVIGVRAPKGQGLEGEVELRFAGAVEGPLVLGRTRFLGGGVFGPA